MKTFEKPLSAKEEIEYLEKYRDGDVKAGEILIIRNMRLVAHMAKHYALSDKDPMELISIGTLGLIKAVKSFDCSKGI
ncbi:MAG: RNA polymerase subunit sigma-70, partial [Butyrivibrio sp.]|nr:RNA polymerase subunit sigma-70 [Butyrivibrio sp.]